MEFQKSCKLSFSFFVQFCCHFHAIFSKQVGLVGLRSTIFMYMYVYMRKRLDEEYGSTLFFTAENGTCDVAAVTCLPRKKMANSDSLLACGTCESVTLERLD